MPMRADTFNNNIASVYSSLQKGDKVEASMLIEEILGDTFRQWRLTPDDETACELIAATCAYATVMTASQRFHDAYSACMTALAYTSKSTVDTSGMLALCLVTWQIFEKALQTSQPTENTAAKERVGEITSSLGTMLYHYYYTTGHMNPEDAALADAYSALRVIMNLVEISPDMPDRTPLVAKILQASESIGLIQ